MIETTYQPKGSMCMNCKNASKACGNLPFSTMQILKRYPDGTAAVKCSNYKASND